jgi:hypothetical protein
MSAHDKRTAPSTPTPNHEFRERGVRTGGPFGRRLASLLATLLMAAAMAQPVAELGAPVRWLSATERGVAALLEDGRVVELTGGRLDLLDTGWQGDTLIACGGRLFGIDAYGRLAAARADLIGPRVSPHSTPLCLPDGGLLALSDNADRLYRLTPTLQVAAQRPIDALADTEITALGRAAALLTEPTMRYRHGVLGDEVEAAAVTLIDPDDLGDLGSFRPEAPFVIEQRRAIPFASESLEGLYLTLSSQRTGAGVIALAHGATGLEPLAAGEAIGLGSRWLNLFAAREDRAYSVRTPHIGGPLERYRLEGRELTVERFQLEVTNHAIGSRNLDLGLLLPDVAPGRDLLILPRRDLRALRLIVCDGSGCAVAADFALEGRLTGNPVWASGARGLELYAGDSAGRLYRFELDLP